MARGFEFDVTVLGGCGRVGLPLAIAFADRDLHVGIYDISEERVEQVSQGELPFREPGAAETLRARVADGALQATIDPAVIAASETVVVVIGTPVDEHLNPDPDAVGRALRACEALLSRRSVDRSPQHRLPGRDVFRGAAVGSSRCGRRCRLLPRADRRG